ncbi:MAG: hypothetical protein ACK53K_02035 [Burkholderiales bacterium]|jgi:hypothetical protein
MSTSVYTAAGQRWSAASWIFRHILDRACQVLDRQGHRALAQRFSEVAHHLPGEANFYLAELSPQDQGLFFEALQMAHQRYLVEGPCGWNLPDFYPVFMERFNALLSLAVLKADRQHG